MHVYSQLISAQFELKASDYSAGTPGRVWFNTGSSLAKFDDGSAIRTFVTTDNTQTLTNKTISSASNTLTLLDSTTSIKDNSDNTKIAAFECSGISTGTTRTFTFPDASTTLVGTDNTATFTNKTWNGVAVITTYGGTGLSSFTAGDLVYYASGTTFTKLAIGTSGKVLQSSGSAPQWVSPSALAVAVTSKTHADDGYTILNTDDLLYWTLTNGSNDSATMPSVSSNAGKAYKIRLAATTANFNTLTINRAGSDTFTLPDGTTGATSIKLQTGGECYELTSDGTATWIVTAHACTTKWIAYTMTTTGLGTISDNAAFYRRVGDTLEVSAYFVTGTCTAADASFSLPTNLSIDTAKLAKTGNDVTGAGGMVGTWVNNAANAIGAIITATATSTSLVYAGDDAGSSAMLTPADGSAAAGNSAGYSVNFKVPISGWVG